MSPSTTATPDQPDAAGSRVLQIRHTHAEGTVLDGTRRADDLYRELRSLGWLWRHSCGDFRLQGSVDRPAKTHAINATADALRHRGFTVEIEIDNTPRPAEQAETDLANAAQLRASRLAGRAERHAAEADRRDAAGRQVLDGIPPGQPYLVDHSSYPADRRRRERADLNLQRAAESRTLARDTQRAADIAANRMASRHAPETVVNRIRTLEADLRRAERELDHPTSSETRTATLTARKDWLEEQVAHWRHVRQQQVADGAALDLTRDQVRAGHLVHRRDLWHLVLRTNPRTVTVPSPHGGTSTWTLPYEHLDDHVTAEDPRWRTTVAAALTTAYRLAIGCDLHPALQALHTDLGRPDAR